ncbi:hypothetical protein RCO48_33940 [Peribacillus frigoritolerans]|nr:hypothetical protein [Peribacillus frigoritolerans]
MDEAKAAFSKGANYAIYGHVFRNGFKNRPSSQGS